MKHKDIQALHNKTREELTKELLIKQRELQKLVTEKKLTQLKNTRLPRALKDDIARISTMLSSIKHKEIKA